MVRLNTKLLKDASNGFNRTLAEILVCPLSKQPLRFCAETNSLISDAIGVSFPIKDGIPCLVPKDGKILDLEDESKPEVSEKSSTKHLKWQLGVKQVTPASSDPIEPMADRKLEDALEKSTAEPDSDEGEEFCCICLSVLTKEEETSLLPCKHWFHKCCVERWWFSASNKTCPVCRFSIEAKHNHSDLLLTEDMIIYLSSFHAAGF